MLSLYEPLLLGRGFWALLILAAYVSSLRASEKFQPDSAEFTRLVRPYFSSHCVRCHGDAVAESDMRLDVDPMLDFTDPSTKEHWSEIVNVINSHEMPPESEPQPDAAESAAIVEWAVGQMKKAELIRRDQNIVIRRLNRDEYRLTIRELTGVDFDVSGFPLDPLAEGFDNNGSALSMSPMQMELYVDAARKILDRAIVMGVQPKTVRYRFQPEVGNGDDSRVRYDEYNAIVHGGQNPVEGDFKVLHHASWDRVCNAREFALPEEGVYKIRIRAGGKVPGRDDVVRTASAALEHRFEQQMRDNSNGEKYHREAMTCDMLHFENDRIYNYGPPRLKLIHDINGQPIVVSEFDVDAPVDQPAVYEFQARFNTNKTSLSIEYAYSIPSVMENFWFQSHDTFARPVAYLDWFEIEGPINDDWPPKSHRQILGDLDLSKEPDPAQVRKVVALFLRRAFRRPVSDEEIQAKLQLYTDARKSGKSVREAIQLPLVAILCSPKFLFLCEPVPTSAPKVEEFAARKLTTHELATRLSYFLWSSMPDAELFKAASKGDLRDKKVLTQQAKRMLEDPRSEAFITNFTEQWLGVRAVGANPPAMDLYPQYDRHLEASMRKEGAAFFEEILRNDLDVRNFVKSDFVVINERLARFYGIDNVHGDSFRRVSVGPEVHRGGLLTQAAVHTITSNGTRTSPVKRGTWVMTTMLGQDPGLPVANAGDIAPKVPGIDKATVRKRLEIHRTLALCARCHNKIDPLGFALENYDASGFWRDKEGFGYKGRVEANDPDIDASSKLPDGTAIVGVSGLQNAILKNETLFLNCLSKKMLTYALGREMGLVDTELIEQASRYMQTQDYRLRALVEYVVCCEAFQNR